MSYQIPLSNKAGIIVDFQGSVRFSMCRWNNIMRCWVTDFTWNNVTVLSLALRSGTNILKQYGVPFNIYVVNMASPTLDPGNFSTLTAYIVETADLA